MWRTSNWEQFKTGADPTRPNRFSAHILKSSPAKNATGSTAEAGGRRSYCDGGFTYGSQIEASSLNLAGCAAVANLVDLTRRTSPVLGFLLRFDHAIKCHAHWDQV